VATLGALFCGAAAFFLPLVASTSL
jgi:hypothetical protein